MLYVWKIHIEAYLIQQKQINIKKQLHSYLFVFLLIYLSRDLIRHFLFAFPFFFLPLFPLTLPKEDKKERFNKINKCIRLGEDPRKFPLRISFVVTLQNKQKAGGWGTPKWMNKVSLRPHFIQNVSFSSHPNFESFPRAFVNTVLGGITSFFDRIISKQQKFLILLSSTYIINHVFLTVVSF